MTDPRSDRILMALLESEEDALRARSGRSQQDARAGARLPSLDERVDMFVAAVHGSQHLFTAQARAAARQRILSAMAVDLAEQSMGARPAPADAPEPAPEAAPARSVERALGIAAKLVADLRQAVAAGGDARRLRGMRMAAVSLVAVLAVVSIWSTQSIYFRTAPEPAPTEMPGPTTEVDPAPAPPATRGLAPSPEAEEALRRSIFNTESALGPSHPDVAEMLVNLGSLYQSQQRHVEAEALYERALAIRERALGPRHPDVATTLNQLAQVYRLRGRAREAQELADRAAAIAGSAPPQ